MRVGGSSSLTIADAINRELGKVRIRDVNDTALMAGVLKSGMLGSQEPAYNHDFHLNRPITEILYRDSNESGILTWGSDQGTLVNNAALQHPWLQDPYAITTGNVAGDRANMWKEIPGGQDGSYKWIVDYFPLAAGGIDFRDIEFRLNFYPGTSAEEIHIKYECRAAAAFVRRWQYKDIAGVWQNFAGGGETILYQGAIFRYQRMELDFTVTAGTAIIDALRTGALNLTAVAGTVQNVPGNAHFGIQPWIEITTDAAANMECYIAYVGIFRTD